MSIIDIGVSLDAGQAITSANELAAALERVSKQFGSLQSNATVGGGGDASGFEAFRAQSARARQGLETEGSLARAPQPEAAPGKPAPEAERSRPDTPRTQARLLEFALKRGLGGLSPAIGALGQGNMAGATRWWARKRSSSAASSTSRR
jgi:hypothetical protein